MFENQVTEDASEEGYSPDVSRSFISNIRPPDGSTSMMSNIGPYSNRSSSRHSHAEPGHQESPLDSLGASFVGAVPTPSVFRRRRRANTEDSRTRKVQKVFVDAESMKAKVRASALQPQYDVSDYYHTTGIWQAIARHPLFETITLCVIAVNALWIAIDTDMNDAEILIEAHPVFQLAEHAFCFFFAFEWAVRFMSFRSKRKGFRDGWFVFDSALVFIMFVETWVMSIIYVFVDTSSGSGWLNASILRMARLLRLSRMARMARIFKSMPEALIMIRAMLASIRSCFFVFFVLGLMMYIFGITFRQLLSGSAVGGAYFSSVLQSIHTLWLQGTLMDDTRDLVNELWDESIWYVLFFHMYVLLSALTVLNMLIGVLCEVVSAVAATEKEGLTVSWVKQKMLGLMYESGIDANQDRQISKEEFSRLLDYPEACQALSDIGVDIYYLIDNIDFIFAADRDGFGEEGDKTLSFENFMELVLDLRGSNTATVKDIMELRKFLTRSNRCVKKVLADNEKRMERQVSAGAQSLMLQPGAVWRRMETKLEEEMASKLESGLKDPGFISGLKDNLQQLVRDTMAPEFESIKTTLRRASVESQFTCCAPRRQNSNPGPASSNSSAASPKRERLARSSSNPSSLRTPSQGRGDHARGAASALPGQVD